MSSGNSGEQLLKLIAKAAWFIILLLPGLFKLIYRGILWIIAQFQGKNNENEQISDSSESA